MAETPPVDLIARIDVPERHRPEVLQMLEDYSGLVRAEPGNRRFEVYASADDERSVLVVERYASRAAFEAHLRDPANAAFNDALARVTGGVRSSLEFLSAAGADSGAATPTASGR